MASTTAASSVALSLPKPKQRPELSALQTPVSASYPSEIRSPLPGTPAYIKQEDMIKTPITPPNAYLDFLKTMSPALASPALTGTGSHFSFTGRIMERDCAEGDYRMPELPASHPSISRTSSSDSTLTVVTVESDDTDTSEQSFESTESNTLKREHSPEPGSAELSKPPAQAQDSNKSKEFLSSTKARPESPRIVIPSMQTFARPASARLSQRAPISGSPLTPAFARTPLSARSHHEPRSASCLSGTPWSASFPPTDEDSSSKTSKVCVRQVVTQTLTYSCTELDPAPKGKRRKLED